MPRKKAENDHVPVDKADNTDKPPVTKPATKGNSRTSLRRERFVEEAAKPGATLKSAAIAAGYPESSAKFRGSELMAREDVRQAVEDKRTQAQIAAGLSLEHVWRRLGEFIDDDKPSTRTSAVRSAELALRAAREVGPEMQVDIDSRSLILPALDASSLRQMLREAPPEGS